VADVELPSWSAAATAAAVRLAAEAGADVDDILRRPGESSPLRLRQHIARLEQSADATEIATDLAGLLWAECEEVPPIDILLEEPSSRSALEAVAEARRHAARRLSAGVPAAGPGPGRSSFAGRPAPAPATPVPARSPAVDASAPAPAPPTTAVAPAARHATVAGQARRPAAAVAGAAAAALLLYSRRLRRA